MTRLKKGLGIKTFPSGIIDVDAGQVDGNIPLVYSMDVGWGDCDPAQIAYTSRIPEWGLRAIENWYRHCLGVDWYAINLRHGLGTPFVSLNCQFHAPITPDHALDTVTYVTRLGNRSLAHQVEGLQDDILCFTMNTTAAFVDASSMQSVPIPENARSRIQQYMEKQNKEFTQ